MQYEVRHFCSASDVCLWLRVCALLSGSLFCRLCLSITDFHPDTWNPAWSVSTILTGLLSFMVEKGPTLGSIETSDFTVRGHGLACVLPPPPPHPWHHWKDPLWGSLFSAAEEQVVLPRGPGRGGQHAAPL